METFGQRLIRLRRERGALSRYAVAKGAGISQPLMKHLETLHTADHVSGLTLRKLARFFGLSMDALYDPSDPEEEPYAA